MGENRLIYMCCRAEERSGNRCVGGRERQVTGEVDGWVREWGGTGLEKGECGWREENRL